MSNSSLGNDEIHHFEGKNPAGSCRVSNNLFTEESDPPPPPPHANDSSPHQSRLALEQQKLEKGRHQCCLKRFFIQLFSSSFNNTNITIMNFYGPVNMNGCNLYDGTSKKSQDEPIEDIQFEEVTAVPERDTTVEPMNAGGETTCKSPLLPYFTYRQQAEFTLRRMHQVMDIQETDREKIKFIYATCKYEVFNARIPYKVYAAEFGDDIQQPRYSTLMNGGGKYTEQELKLALKSIFLQFPDL